MGCLDEMRYILELKIEDAKESIKDYESRLAHNPMDVEAARMMAVLEQDLEEFRKDLGAFKDLQEAE